MKPGIRIGLVAIGCVLGTPAFAEVTVTFEPIVGALSANDLSPDGKWVVGEVDIDGDFFPDGGYRWNREIDNFLLLPSLGLRATAISDNGGVVLGDIPDPTGVGLNVAARWTLASGWVSLGFLPHAGACPSRSDGYELSSDECCGRPVLGRVQRSRFRLAARRGNGGTSAIGQRRQPSVGRIGRRNSHRRLCAGDILAHSGDLGRHDHRWCTHGSAQWRCPGRGVRHAR